MKLHDNQIDLLRHLARFNLLDYESCLDMLDTAGTGDRVALSYAFRPLTKNGYLTKRKDGTVAITKKGRSIVPKVMPLISAGGGTAGTERVLQVSRVAMLMEKNRVPCMGGLWEPNRIYFIPSACWRKIATGILSTTRFAGMLMIGKRKIAVYDIGDGHVEWQIRAEGSLFYWYYGSFETKANGMLFICKDEGRTQVAKAIIRETMWNRKKLLAETSETDKPVKWSRSPIKLRAQYEHVYLTTPESFDKDLDRIIEERQQIKMNSEGCRESNDPTEGDCSDHPYRYFINPASDLLKYVYFFSTVKEDLKYDHPGQRIRYGIYFRSIDRPILEMYPDVMKEVIEFEYCDDEDLDPDTEQSES